MMSQKCTSPTENFGKFHTNPWHIAISGVGCFLIATIVFRSTKLSLPFSLIGSTIPLIRIHRKNEKRSAFLATVWPELLDHMISGLRAGLSIAETLCSLATRGPQESREIFVEAEVMLREGVDLSAVFSWMKSVFNNPIADQVCEVLDFARDTGSRDTSQTLRTLGDFIRSDIAVRGEVEAKLGWVKNSALVAAIAPWILLLILSAQPTTVAAFSTPTGFAILAIGVALSVIAYFWMGKVGNIAQIPRIFAESDPSKNKPGPQSRVLENIGVRKIVSLRRLRDRTDYGNA
jgi:tight adherence protein B